MTVDKAKLIDAVNILNEVVYKEEGGAEVSLLQETISMDSPDDSAALMTAFKNACESIPERLEVHIPDDVSNVYNYLADHDWALKEKKVSAVKEKVVKEKVVKEKVVKEKVRVVKEKKAKFTRAQAFMAALQEGGDAKTICERMDAIYVENGGDAKPKQCRWLLLTMMPAFLESKVVDMENGIYKANF